MAKTLSVFKIAGRVEKFICYSALVLMAALPVTEVILRPLGIVIPYSKPLLVRLFLVTGLFAAMLTTQANEHISIAVLQFAKNKKIKNGIIFITGLVSTFVTTILFWDSVSFLKYSLSGGIGFISDRIFAAAMPVAYGVMALRFAFHSKNVFRAEANKAFFPAVFPFAAVILGTAAALPAIAKIVWGFEPPEPFFSLVNVLYDFAFYAKTPLILFLILAALSGTPIFAAIGGIAVVMLQAAGSEPEAVPIQIYSALTESDIIAIPLFTLTGFFLSESRAGERLVAAFKSLFSWLPGGMIIATVVICAFFTSFTGASGITILALGGILYTILTEKSCYPAKFSIGLLTSSGGIGVLFPPSLPIILVATTINSILYFMGETITNSVVDFFLAAIIPGLILVTVTIAFGISSSLKVKIPRGSSGEEEAGKPLKSSVFEILLPVVLIAGYFSGVLTLVEVSAFSAVYVLVVEVFINRDIAIADLPKVFYKSVPIIGGVLSILAMSKALSYAIIDSGVPEDFALWMRSTIESKYVFLLLLNLALLVVGCLMDIFSAILVVLPLIVPLAQVYDVSPVHLGIIFIVNLEVGFLTPPVGMNLFLASYRFKKPFSEICRYVLPFLIAQIFVVLLVTYVPSLSSFLAELFG